ncbi:hypothetical protein MXB_5481, partial [Myxobolus squamalis]
MKVIRIILPRQSVLRKIPRTFMTSNHMQMYIASEPEIFRRYLKPTSYVKKLLPFIRKSSSNFPDHKFAKLPSLSPTMETGNIASWSKKEGDKLEEGDILCQIETDKAVMAMETPFTGYLAKILYPNGTKNIVINQQIAIIVNKKEDVVAFEKYDTKLKNTENKTATATEKIEPIKSESPPRFEVIQSEPTTFDRVRASPFAKKIAHELGVNLSNIKGSGPNGRIVSCDIPVSKPPVSAAAFSNYLDVDISSVRAIIAKRLVQSKTTIPHFHVTLDVNMDSLVALREKVNKKFEGKRKISINDFIIKAASLTLLDVPECNSHWMDSYIRKYLSTDISVAVSTKSGLITPIVFNASNKVLESFFFNQTISTISSEIGILAEKARENKLTPAEFQ